MIILQANKFFYEKGGSERYMFELSRALESRGHRIVNFSMAHPLNVASEQSKYFVPERDYGAGAFHRGAVSAAMNFVRSPLAARLLSRLLSDERPDVAHLHNIYHQLTPSIIDVLHEHRIPVVMTLHDYKLVCPSYTMFANGEPCYRCRGGRFHHAVTTKCGGDRARSLLLAVESYWQRWTRVYDQVDCFIAPSEYLRGVMLDAGIAESRIVHVAQLSPESGEDAGEAAPQVPPPADLPPRFVAYLGRLSAEKGIDVLLEAMTLAREVPLVVLGDGPMGAELRGMADARGLTNVFFAGHVSRPVVDAALSRSVALVVPSLWAENAPMVLFEAAAAGVPVIVSDRGGLPELAARMGGRVVPAGKAEPLAAVIHSAWSDESGWKEACRTEWQRHRTPHEAGAHARAVEVIYEGVARTRGAVS